MSLHYQLVFGLLIFECAVFALLVAPFPQGMKRTFFKWFSSSSIVASFIYSLKILFIFVFILFLDALSRNMKATQEYRLEHASILHSHDARADDVLRSKMFYAQRNLYLTGFTLFLSLILNRFYTLNKELFTHQEKVDAVEKQAKNARKEYLRMVDESDALKKQIEEMKEKVASADKAKTELEVVKKQAKQNHDQYMELSDRYNDMEKKYDQLRGSREGDETSKSK
ncbi:Endoplasmic reticulum transmembrane protein 3 [Sorochytrium milnesiophthora]